MIKLRFEEPTATPWLSWRQKVKDELAALQAMGRPYAVKDELYKEQRETIFACYLNKCAYCEGHYRLTANEGDVEHYRPKGRVRDRSNAIVKVVVGGESQNHPGYWWLAYEPINLLPSCAFCNRTGKRDLFPLEPGCTYALVPGEEANERPLLVHPGLDDPDEHLLFDSHHGVLAPKTERGRFTIETFQLNREDLLRERRRTYRNVVAAIKAALALEASEFIDLPDVLADLKAYKSGKAAYSLAGRKAIHDCRAPLKSLIERVTAIMQD